MILKYAIVFLGAALLYGVSCAPGAVWQDSGLIQYRVWHNDLEGFLGLALSHPLYYLVAIGAKYVPLGEFGHRVNLVSALAAAVAVANLYLLVRLWLGRDFPAVIAAVTLAASHTFWWHASIAETYTLWAALFLGELVVLLQYLRGEGVPPLRRETILVSPCQVTTRPSRPECKGRMPSPRENKGRMPSPRRVGYLYGLGLLNGLALAVHMLAVIPLVCYVVVLLVLLVRRRIRVKDFAIVAALWVVGALPYEYLILKDIVQTGDVLGTLASVAFGARWRAEVLNTSLSWKLLRENIQLLVLNFPTPNALLFLVGLYGLRRIGRTSAFRNVLVALLVLSFVFAARYTIADRFAFFLPFYCLVAVVIGLGVHELIPWGVPHRNPCRRRPAFGARAGRPRHVGGASPTLLVFAVLPVAVYALAPELAPRLNLSLGTRQDIPYRDDYEYFLRPWRTGDRGAERFARAALEIAEPDAIICADTTTVAPLLYVQEVQGLRPDVKIVTGIARSREAPRVDELTIGRLLQRHPIYVVSRQPGYCPSFILARHRLAPAGVLWRVEPFEPGEKGQNDILDKPKPIL